MPSNFLKKLFNKTRADIDAAPNAFLKNSELLEQVEHERAVYLDVLQKQLQSLQQQGISYETELELTPPNKSKKQKASPMRVDAMYHDAGEIKPVEANIANPPQFETITEDWDDIEVTLEPFVWNVVEFDVIGPFPDLTQLNNWFIKWYDVKNRNKAGEDGLKSVVHKMTLPVATAEGWSIAIDFGSASTEALIAFYKQCRFNDAEAITLRSAKYLDQLQNYNLMNTTASAAIKTTAHPM